MLDGSPGCATAFIDDSSYFSLCRIFNHREIRKLRLRKDRCVFATIIKQNWEIKQMAKITTHKASSYNQALHQKITQTLDDRLVESMSRDDVREALADMDLYLAEKPPTVIRGVYAAKTGDATLSARKLYKDVLKRQCQQDWYASTANVRVPRLVNQLRRRKDPPKLSYRNAFAPDFCEVKFTDEEKVPRTSGLHHEDALRMKQPDKTNSRYNRMVLQKTGYATKKISIVPKTGLKFRPLHTVTRDFLKDVLLGNPNFASIFVKEPVHVVEDIRCYLSEGPILSAAHVVALLRHIVSHFDAGIDAPPTNRALFESGAAVLAHYLINATAKASSFLGLWRHYSMQRVHTAPEKMEELLKNGVVREFTKMLEQALTVPTTGHVRQDVHRAAGAAAMVIKAAYICAAHIDSINEDHKRHLAFMTSLAFAVVGAVLAGVPFGVAAGVPDLIKPFEELIQGRMDKRYSTGVLKDAINKFIDLVEANARIGSVVPAFRIRPNYGAHMDKNDEVTEIRQGIGKDFNELLETNLGSCYRAGMTPSNFYKR